MPTVPDHRVIPSSEILPRNSDGSIRPWAQAGDRLRVLVVDDHVDTARTLAELVACWGHVAAYARSAAEALETAQVVHPSVVLLDLSLPDQHGYQLARALRQRVIGRVHFVAITGWSQGADQAQSSAAGIEHHLVKPVNQEALREILERYASPAQARTPAAQ